MGYIKNEQRFWASFYRTPYKNFPSGETETCKIFSAKRQLPTIENNALVKMVIPTPVTPFYTIYAVHKWNQQAPLKVKSHTKHIQNTQ